MQNYIAKRILLTLSYTEQFKFPLTKRELYYRLLVGKFVGLNDFNNALNFLQSQHLVEYLDGYFFIAGLSEKKMEELVKTRKKRAIVSEQKWLELNEFLKFAKNIPFITGIAVTGSLAVNNAVKNDDIDFMIVTTPGRMWIARLITILYSSLKGKRRSFAKEELNSWCFNLWIEESDLQLPIESRSVYEAYEVIQAVWVLSKSNVASRFRFLNSWIGRLIYMGNSDFKNISCNFEKEDWTNNSLLMSGFLYLINCLSFQFQYLYMKPHMTREKVSKSHAFFHPRDTKSVVFNNWKKTLLRLR